MSEYLHLQKKRWLYLFTIGQSLNLSTALHYLSNHIQTQFCILHHFKLSLYVSLNCTTKFNMFSPHHTHQASASTTLPAEPQYWMENLPAGHRKYNSGIFTVLPLRFAQSGSNDTRSVVLYLSDDDNLCYQRNCLF